MSIRGAVAVVAVALTGLAFGLLAGHGPWAGRELVGFTGSHGLNVGDLPVIATWLVGMACCWRLWREG